MNIVMINDLMKEITTKGTTVKDNIKISNGTSVNFENELKSLIKNDPSSVDYNFINNRPIFNDNSVANDKLVNISNEDIITSLSEEFVDNVNKLVDIVEPLIKKSYGENILKEDIIKAIKDKLEVLDSKDKNVDNLEDSSLNIINLKQNKVLDKISYSTDMGKINNNSVVNERLVNISNEDIVASLSDELVNNVNKLVDIVAPLIKNSYEDNSLKDNIIKAIKNKLEVVDIEDKNVDRLENNSLNIITSLSEELVDNVNKLVDIVVPLIKNSYGENILKDDIIKAVINKLEAVDIEDKNEYSFEDSSLNITNIKSGEGLDKILYSAEIGVINDKFDSVDYNFINNRRMFKKNSPSNIYKLVAVPQKDITTNLSEELVDNVKKLVDIVSPLVKNSYNDNILKDDIIAVIKNKLEVAEIEDKDASILNDSSLNITNVKSNEELDKNPYSEEIGVVNNFIMELPIKERLLKNKINALNGDNFTFKDVIKDKNSDINKFEYLSIGKATVEDNNVSKELEEKLEKIQQSMKSNNKEEVIEEVVDILNLLNINIVNNSSLPIIVHMPKPEKQLMQLVENEYRVTNILEELEQEVNKPIDIMLPLVKNSYGDNMAKSDTVKVVKNQQEDFNIEGRYVDRLEVKTLNSTSLDTNKVEGKPSYGLDNKYYSDELLNVLDGDTITNLPQKSVENINKLLESILPLVKNSNGENIIKDDIIHVIKKKLELVDIEEKELYTFKDKSLNVLSTKQNNILERAPYKVDGENYLNKVETDQLGNLNFKTITVKELSQEDKILNKALGLETIDNFSQVINRLNIRNDIQTEKTISSSTVFKDTMDEDIVKNIRFMIKNQVQELKVKIYPKELGEMTIKILSEEGIMRAEIKAISKETYHLLHSNINEIKNSLSNENIKIQEVNIGLYNDDTTYYSGQGSREGFNQGNGRFTANNNEVYINDNKEEIEEVINSTDSNVDLLV